MATMIWVYSIHPDYMIVKRNPFSCQIPVLSYSGKSHLEIPSGVSIALPTWDWVKKVDGHLFAGWRGKLYEVSDIAPIIDATCIDKSLDSPK